MLMIPTLYRITGEHLPAVLHIAARTVGTHAMSIFGDHSDVMACRQIGVAQVCSGSVQEAADMAAVAHLSAIKSRVPFMHFFDGFRTSHEMSRIDMPDVSKLTALMDTDALDELYEKLDELTQEDILCLAGSIPASMPSTMYSDIMKHLEGRGIRIVVDATKDLLMNVLEYKPFLIKPHNHEIGELFNVRLNTRDEVVPYAKKLQEKGAMNVLVSMAGEGAVLVDENGKVYQSEAPKGKVVNSVGAGDSMVAGFIYGYLNYQDYAEAFRYGLATGSASAFKEELATKEDVETLYTETWGEKR